MLFMLILCDCVLIMGILLRPQKIGGSSLKVQQKKTSPSEIGILRPGFQKPWARQEFGPTQQKSRGLDPDNSDKQLVTWRIENKKGPKVSCPLAAIIWSVYNDLGQAQKGVALSGRWGKTPRPQKGEVRAEIKTLTRVEQEGQVMDHRSNQDTSTCPAFKLLLYKPVAFSKTTKKITILYEFPPDSMFFSCSGQCFQSNVSIIKLVSN